MKRTMGCAVLGLAVCVLLQGTPAGATDQVTRPYRSAALVTWTVNMLDGSATGHEEGVATHVGRYTNEAEVVWDLENFVIVSGTGVGTAANGDQLFWSITSYPDQPNVVHFTGGTGRFENLSGSIVAVSMSEPIITVDPTTMTMTITLSYIGAGTITY